MDRQSSSPSARFYANRSPLTPTEMDQDYQQASEMHRPYPSYEEPFSHFQGLSSSATAHHYTHPQFGAYGCHIPDEMISPCTPIPNPVMCDSPGPRVQEELLNEDDNDVPGLYHRAFEHHASNTRATCGSHGPPSRHWLPPHCYAAEPQRPSLPVHTGPTPTGTTHAAAPDQDATMTIHAELRRPVAIRVPSCSPLSSLTSLPVTGDSTIPGAGPVRYEAMSIPPASQRGGSRVSTVHPDDSISTVAHSPALGMNNANFLPGMRRDFADDVVAIHDICLAATQRHLETLHANWDLRNGAKVCPTAGPDRGHGRGHAGARGRWSPYAPPARRRRRARSDTDLHTLASNRNGDQAQHHHAAPHQTEQNPIPLPTNSLLQNIHHVCSIIWRRSQRDREDVLGAEVNACRDMGFFHQCAETIVLYNTTNYDNDPDGCLERVLEAGKGICRELRDCEGMRLLERAEVGSDE